MKEELNYEAGKELENLHYFSVDSHDEGISWGSCKVSIQDPRSEFFLRLEKDSNQPKLRRRYAFNPDKYLGELEKQLMGLSRRGILRRSVIFFGVHSDPFIPFEGKFDATMKFIDLFRRFEPGLLVIQTRSPLIVLALPVLKKMGRHVSVTMGIETNLEEVALRYSPGLPRISERLRTVTALRRLGITVGLQVGPLLPYGDWRTDADAFADLLIEHADHISVRTVTDGSVEGDRRARKSRAGKLLVSDRRYHWLRRDSGKYLLNAIEAKAPKKLIEPKHAHLEKQQLSIFVA